MYESLIEKNKNNLQNAVDHLRSEISSLRTGRANPKLVEDIAVDYYGAKTPIKQLANINVPEPRLIVISPWDKGSLVNVEAAIRASDLDLVPNNDGNVIRLVIPQLNEERRVELVKILNKKVEEAKIAVRNVREEVWREIQNLEKGGKISEDDKFRAKDKLQAVVDEYNKAIDEQGEKKEKEIMTI
jgi:ribosome recycling factor